MADPKSNRRFPGGLCYFGCPMVAGIMSPFSNARPWVWWGVLASVLVGHAAPALAYEDQLSLSFGLGYGSSPVGERPQHGGLLGVAAAVGLDDVFTLRARLDYGVHPDPDATQHRGMFGVEFLYLVDILAWVPYFGAGVAGLGWFGRGDPEPDAGVYLVGGLDYLWQRTVIFGFEGRGLAVARAPHDDFAQLLFMVTATYLWEIN